MSPVVRSREEILDKQYEGKPYAAIKEKEVLAAMDEYAKQESIGFAEWINGDYTEVESAELRRKAWVNFRENEVLVHGSDFHYTTLINEVGLTTEQLFELYLQSKQPTVKG